MPRYTPNAIHNARTFTLRAFQCVPVGVLTEQIEYLASQLADATVKLTIAERDRLNRLVIDMGDACEYVHHQNAVRAFTTS